MTTDKNILTMIFTNVFQQLKSPEKALYFRFWANCIPVQGYRRTLVYDIQRERIFYISNLFFEIFQKNKNKSIHDIYNDDSDDNRMGYLKIIDFLISRSLITQNLDKEFKGITNVNFL